jgi:hypothetical protein
MLRKLLTAVFCLGLAINVQASEVKQDVQKMQNMQNVIQELLDKGYTREELLGMLNGLGFSSADQTEIKAAIDNPKIKIGEKVMYAAVGGVVVVLGFYGGKFVWSLFSKDSEEKIGEDLEKFRKDLQERINNCKIEKVDAINKELVKELEGYKKK